MTAVNACFLDEERSPLPKHAGTNLSSYASAASSGIWNVSVMSTSVPAAASGVFGQLTYSHANQTAVDRGFGAIPYPQLGEDAAHMMGHGLPTHEQPVCDLRVGQSLTEQAEHVSHSRCEHPDAAAAGSRRDAKSPQKRGDPISVDGGAELLVRRLCATCVLDSKVRSLGSDDQRECNVDLRPLIRQAQVVDP